VNSFGNTKKAALRAQDFQDLAIMGRKAAAKDGELVTFS